MGSPNQYDWCPYKKGKCGHRTGTHNTEFCEKTQREGCGGSCAGIFFQRGPIFLS